VRGQLEPSCSEGAAGGWERCFSDAWPVQAKIDALGFLAWPGSNLDPSSRETRYKYYLRV
jgi:hypothetical protein